MTRPASWDEIKPGDIITIRKFHSRITRRTVVESVDLAFNHENREGDDPMAYVVGVSITGRGTPNYRLNNSYVRKGKRVETLWLRDVESVERPADGMPTTKTRQPAKLTETMIDALHFLGATDATRARYYLYKPVARTIDALRARGMVRSNGLDLSTTGRDAYLANEPTGLLPRAFADDFEAAHTLWKNLKPNSRIVNPAEAWDAAVTEYSDRCVSPTLAGGYDLMTELPTAPARKLTPDEVFSTIVAPAVDSTSAEARADLFDSGGLTGAELNWYLLGWYWRAWDRARRVKDAWDALLSLVGTGQPSWAIFCLGVTRSRALIRVEDTRSQYEEVEKDFIAQYMTPSEGS